MHDGQWLLTMVTLRWTNVENASLVSDQFPRESCCFLRLCWRIHLHSDCSTWGPQCGHWSCLMGPGMVVVPPRLEVGLAKYSYIHYNLDPGWCSEVWVSALCAVLWSHGDWPHVVGGPTDARWGPAWLRSTDALTPRAGCLSHCRNFKGWFGVAPLIKTDRQEWSIDW